MKSTSPMSSKKFRAFLLALFSWTVLIGACVTLWLPLDQWATITLLGMIVCKGVVEVGYILGVTGLDALTALFDIITPDSLFGKKKPEDEQK